MLHVDVTYGNVALERAERMAKSVVLAQPMALRLDYPGGATEAWVSALVAGLLKATGIPSALETGAFQGHTTVWLAQALRDMGGGDLHVAELDPARADDVAAAVASLELSQTVHTQVHVQDALTVIQRLPDQSLGLAFLDDDHTMAHVAEEIEAVWPKIASGGIITFHDVFGVCDLQRIVRQYGGYALDFPRCGPAGGLGLLQVR